MARTYDVLFDFGEVSDPGGPGGVADPDSITVDPYAVIAIWRYRFPVTFSRKLQTSFSREISDAIRLRDQVLVVVDDLQQLQIQHSKASHISQLQAALLPGMNYLVEAFPGDWIGAWMVYGRDKVLKLIDRIQNGDPCNRFLDGLKFLGRVTGVRKRIQQQPQGIRNTVYSINAAGFTEFDAQLYFEPYLASNVVGTATDWLRKTALHINQVMAENGQGLDVNKAIPLFLDTFYGTGVPKNEGLENSPVPTTAGPDNPDTMVIPDPVAAILGVSQGSKPNGKKSWTDILEVLQGVQKHEHSVEPLQQNLLEAHRDGDDIVPGAGVGAIFAPDGVPSEAGTRRRQTRFPLMGIFLPSPPQFDGQKTVWSILQQYLNPAVNEMFCCLRTNPQGQIFPTLVVRQLPFSSGVLNSNYTPVNDKRATDIKQNRARDLERELKQATAKGNTVQVEELTMQREGLLRSFSSHEINLTRFMELPRWRIHPVLIKGVDLGRSDSLRFNFIHVYPETGLSSQDRTGYIVRDPPVRDDLDINRSGLRPYLMSVNCAPADAINRKAGDWMYVLSDIIMGQHLLLTGTLETVGIQSPICPGDNIEFDGHVLHIESVSHLFQIQPGNGQKSFGTTLALTHGMKAAQATGGDFSLFSGTAGDDLTKNDAGQSREYGLSNNTPSVPEKGQEQDSVKPKTDINFDSGEFTADFEAGLARVTDKIKKK